MRTVIFFLFCLATYSSYSQIIFSESFDEPDGATTGVDNVGNTSWTSSCPDCLDGDFNEVFNGQFFNNDSNGPAYFETEPITTSCSHFEICFDLFFQGDFEPCGSGNTAVDAVGLEFNIDGTGWQTPPSAYPCNDSYLAQEGFPSEIIWDGGLSTSPMSFCSGQIPAGSTVQLRIQTITWASSEQIRFDNLTVECFCNAPSLLITDPTPVCEGESVDLTQVQVTNGSDAGVLSYWLDQNATNPLVNPTSVVTSGTYFIQLGSGNCTAIEPVNVIVNPNPQPNAGQDLQGCEGEDFVIGNNPVYPINGTTYSWSNSAGNGILSSTENGQVTVSPTSSTNYTLTLTDQNGCQSTDDVFIDIISTTDPTFDPIETLCQGDVAPVLPTTSTNGIDGSWSGTIDTSIPGSSNFTFTPASGVCVTNANMDITIAEKYSIDQTISVCNGTLFTFPDGTQQTITSDLNYTASLISSEGCDSIINLSITVIDAYAIDETISICQGEQYTFPDGTTQVINNDLVYTANLVASTGCDSSIITTITILPTHSIVYNINVCEGETVALPDGSNYVVTNSEDIVFNYLNVFGCDSIITVSIEANPIPVVNAGDDVTICTGESLILNGSGAINLNWNQGVENGVSFTPSETLTYTLTGSDAIGCSSTDEVTVAVEESPELSFTATNVEGCAPLLVTLTPDQEYNSCVWNISNGATIEDCGQITFQFPEEGIYSVEFVGTSVNGCAGSYSLADGIIVYPTPNADFTSSETNLSTFDPTVEFMNNSSDATDYQWTINAQDISSDEDLLYTFPEVAAYYYVELFATNEFGCLDSITKVIVVEEEEIFYIPNTFTPDGDEFNQTLNLYVSSGVDFYDFQFVVYDRWGEVIFETRNPSIGWDGTNAINGSLVQSGTYVWKLTFKDKQVDDRKVYTGHVNVLR